MATLKQLCNTQKVLKARLDKFIDNGKKTAIVKRTYGFYEARINDLKALWEEFRSNDLAINEAALQNPPEVPEEYLVLDRFSDAEVKYAEYMGELVDGLHRHAPSPPSATAVTPPTIVTASQQAGPQFDIQLPRISLPKYNGNYDQWRSFHDIFISLVHNNSKLHSVQKLHYLKECLTGDAEALLRHVPITNEDYQPAWEKLKERYENKRILVNHQLKLFLSIPKLSTETSKGLKSLMDTTLECLQQLKSLDVDTSSWDAILIYLLVQRLPFVTLKLWEEEQGSTQALPTFKGFKAFLNNRLRILESISDVLVSKPGAQSKVTIKKETLHTHHAIKQSGCPACHEKHFVALCRKYKSMDATKRRKVLQTAGCCLNCFSRRHRTNECPSQYRCRKCDEKHHTTVHLESKKESGGPKESTRDLHEGSNIPKQAPTAPKIQRPAKEAEETNYIQNFLAMKNHHALLATALVMASSHRGQGKVLRCLIDTGSETSFITEAACKQLGAIPSQTAIAITGLNAVPAATARQQVKLSLRARGSSVPAVEEDFLVLNRITDPLPTKTIQKGGWQHLKDLELADPTFWKSGHIDALLGARVYAKIVQEGIRRADDTSPIAIKTIFGWILMGPTTNTTVEQISTFTANTADLTLDHLLKRFWEIEEIPARPILTKEDETCQQIFSATHRRDADGKYQVMLPFVGNKEPVLGQSRPQAMQRFFALQKQLNRKPQVKEEYARCLNEYIALGHMEAVDPPTNDEGHYYIPHHAVFKDSSTTKLRVVFDASAKTTNGKSLNEQLLIGPTLQPKLCATLLNWRKFKVAMNADIEKMYRMIKMHPAHQTFQRIIWQHPQTQMPQDYQLKTVTFGTACAPYLAIRTLQQLAEDEKKTWPLAYPAMYNSFYVDDLLTGADTVQEAKLLQKQLREITKSGGFKLRKWTSNHPALLEDIPPEDRELKSSLTLAIDEAVKALGVRWHPGPDYFTFVMTPMREHQIATKRNILSEVASLYDPLGWLSPIVIVAKILMQSLWITGYAWDQQVSPQIEQQWSTFKDELRDLQQIQIPRWIGYSTNANMQLHGFCDASTRAYAAVLYLRTTSTHGETSSYLLTSKTRVAPTKPTTIPRLELNAAVILARLIKTIQEDMQLSNIPTFAWTDSMIALQWVKEHPSRWKTYVANRVVEIQETIRYDQWRHIPTSDNPADLASRGVSISSLINNQLWWHGPSWLIHTQDQWPQPRDMPEQTEVEAKRPTPTNFLAQFKDNILLRYSSITRLTRIIALLLRFTHNCKHPNNKRLDYISTEEWKEAQRVILQLIQRTEFPEEYANLLAKKPLARTSRLIKLNPFLDDTGLIRLRGRLHHAAMPYDAKYPIILPQEHLVTHLIIDQIHLATLHGGISLVLATSRQRYWILNGRKCITRRIHKCVTCARHKGHTMIQQMGYLPAPRVNISKPFTKIGLDYAGPVIIKSSSLRNARLQKAYICVIVCLTTKAMHLELVSDLSTTAFILALKRFVGRRGLCSDIYSDCGTNFIGAKSLLDKDIKQAIKNANPKAAQYFASDQITWHFNPPAAPHFGGIWEAGVKSTKYHLRRTLGNSRYTFEEYATVLTQIEACLNSRPLCHVRNDPDDPLVLTPGHFLIGQPLNAIPEPTIEGDMALSRRWKHVQSSVKCFWDKWSTDYLNQLQQRPKWQKEHPNIQIGDIVLIKQEHVAPTKWPLATIEKTFPGPDGLTRVVQVKTSQNSFLRPIAKICRLPIDHTTRSPIDSTSS